MIVLVCGDRNWADAAAIYRELDLLDLGKDDAIIEGHATGADQIAHHYAEQRGTGLRCCPAQWGIHGLAAGPIRNSGMLKYKPDLCLAFHPNIAISKGTKDMVIKALRASVRVRIFES